MSLNSEESTNGKNNNSTIDNDIDSTFKKPQIIVGSRYSKGNFGFSKLNQNDQNPKFVDKIATGDDSLNSEANCEITEKTESKVSCSITTAVTLNYEEPIWSGLPVHNYKLEELKNGRIVKAMDISKKPFSLFGRRDNCDITMAHPTISRYHAILQYRASTDENETVGFYLYDLGSTHGTFLNKQRIKPNVYVKVKVGYVIKLGCSTRLFLLHGPSEDEEPETEMTWTELKQRRLEMVLAKEQKKIQLDMEETELLKKKEENGVDWGMGDDADEETDLSENPFAATQNEELYLDDPKKTLSGWFDREGEELQYNVEEKVFGHFICRVELPVDIGGSCKLIAEASVKGKKKEAIVQCALEACRLLDRHGLLRQANQESRKRIAKDWEAVDFYDSDEDNFLDRTGDVEKKRQQRMAQSGKLDSIVETYETLVKKYEEVVGDLEKAETKLSAMKVPTSENTNDVDDELADFMINLVQNNDTEKKKVKNQIEKLRTEKERLQKLINIAQPASLPSLTPPTSKNEDIRSQSNLSSKKIKFCLKSDTKSLLHEMSEETDNIREDTDAEAKLLINPVSESQMNEKQLEDFENRQKRRNKTRIRHQKVKKDKSATAKDYSNCIWTPPSGQTGDGRTHLNDKLGY